MSFAVGNKPYNNRPTNPHAGRTKPLPQANSPPTQLLVAFPLRAAFNMEGGSRLCCDCYHSLRTEVLDLQTEVRNSGVSQWEVASNRKR